MKKFILYLTAAFCFLLISNSASAQAPAFTYTTPVTLATNQPFPISPINTGGASTNWSISPTVLPTGLTFDSTTGDISGTPTVVTAAVTYTITATNGTGSSNATLVLDVAAGNTVQPVISYDLSPYSFIVGQSVNGQIVVTNSNAVNTTLYKIISGSLPAGLTLNPNTGEIDGTPTTAGASFTATITASTSTGVTGPSTDVTITINTAAPNISYIYTPANPAQLTVGSTILSPYIAPTNTGGAVVNNGATYGAGTVVANAAAGASGMTVDASGDVFVTNVLTGIITEYSAAGATTTTSVGGAPIGIVFDTNGNAYVLDQTAGTVTEYAGGIGGTATTIISPGTGGLLNVPTGIAIDATGRLYIANSGNGTITVYGNVTAGVPTGGAPTLIITANTGTGRFNQRAVSGGIAVGTDGSIYVVDNSRGFFGFGGSKIDKYDAVTSATPGVYSGTSYRQGNNNSAIYISPNSSPAGNIFLTSLGGGGRGGRGAGVIGYSAGFAANIANERGLTSPRGVVTDAAGDLFVSDYTTGAITEYPIIKGWVLVGTLPAGLTFDNTTGIIKGTPVAAFAATTYTVIAYNASGSSTTTVTISCVANPPVISYAPNPALYPVTPTTPISVILTETGPAVLPAGTTAYTAGIQATGLSTPWGMVKDPITAGDIWVVNSNGTVVEYAATLGVAAKTYTIPGAPVLSGITTDPAGNLYVTSTAGTVYKITTTGVISTLTTIFPAVALQGIVYNAATGLLYATASNGNVYRIGTTGGRGNFARTFISGTGLGSATGITVDASGNFYVLSLNGTLTEYSSAGVWERTVTLSSSPGTATYGLYIDANGDYYISDSAGGTVKEYNTAGTLVSTTTTGANPRGILTDATNDIYVAANNSITKYTPAAYYVAVLTAGTAPAIAVLSFNSISGLFSGPGGTAFGPVTYTVTAYSSGGTATTTVTITCTNGPIFTYTTPDTYTDGTAIPGAGLSPAVTQGTPNLWSISTPLPAGLTFSTSTGIISGTPTAVSPATNYVITGTNTTTGLSGTFTINITCVAGPPVITYNPFATDVYLQNTAITQLNLVNTGGPVSSYSINTALPAGLFFDTTTGDITGTPTALSGAITYIVTAHGSAGATVTCTVTISVVSNPVIAYTTPDVYVVGSATSTPCACTTLSPVNTGSTPTSYSISTPLPTGLTFNTTNGQITGTPTVISAATDYTVTATDALGHTGTCIVNITVNPAPPTITYVPLTYSYTAGTTITPIFPVITGSPTSYSISATLPAGLTFNTTNGEILGTPTVASTSTMYTISATNAGGTGSCIVTIVVNALGPVIHYTTPNIYAVGVSIPPLGPVNSGTTPTGYTIAPVAPTVALPAGLNFDPTTGIISGTPSAIFSPAGNYTVTATNASGSGTATFSIQCLTGIDWLGGTSSDWNVGSNWAIIAPAVVGVVPSAGQVACIGVNVPFTNFPTIMTGPVLGKTVGSVIIGNNGGQFGGFIVNSTFTLTVASDITYQSDLNSHLGYTGTAISGAGSVVVKGGINIVANTDQATLATYNHTFSTSVNSLTIGVAATPGTGNISLTASQDGSGAFRYKPVFNITGGTVLLNGAIQTSNTSFSTSTFNVKPATTATLQFANGTPLSGLSTTGTNVVSFNNTGATINYAGTVNQTYYTDFAIPGLPGGGPSYYSIAFSGSGIKTPTGTSVNNLNIAGDFTNTLATTALVYADFSLPTVNFTGAAENIAAGTGTTFYNTTCKGTGTKTIVSGAAYIASTGVLTMGGTATLAAGGLLTLNSDAFGSATVAAIPTGCSITGNVNVQRFLTGGGGHRGYRLLSSPVHDFTTGYVSMNYLLNSCYIKGTAGVAGGFDGGGNPNLYLYRENLAPSNQSFISGNYRGINTLYAGTETVTAGVGAVLTNVNYLVDIDGGPYHVPVGNGYLFFFRGDRNAAGLNAEAIVSYVPTNTTLTAVGPLNQGSITVADWYTPGSPNLGFTNTAGNSTVQGFNLVGNPYASSIDFDTFSQTNAAAGIYGGANVTAFSYIYDAASQNYSVYQQGNNGGGTIATVNANIIPSGQGFFVRATSAAAQLVFNEAAKTNTQATAATGNLFLGMPAPAAISQSLHIMLTRDSVTNNVSRDGILIVFDKDASPKYSRMEDAPHKPGNGTVGLASMSADTVSLAINRMPFPTLQTQKIPLTVTAAATGLYQLNFTATKSIPALYTMWLKDAYKQDSLDIRANPIYSFNIDKSDPASFGANRFSLVMSENPALMVHLLDFNATKAKGGSQVIWKTENEQNYTNFTVERSTDGGVTFTVLGGYASSALGTYSFLDGNPAMKANQYRLKIQDLNGTISYSKVVTLIYGNGDSPLTAHMNVYPNPSTDVINVSIPSSTVSNSQTNLSGLQTLATTPGLVSTNSGSSSSYDIKIISITGSVIKSATSASTNWQGSVSGLAPGTYIIQVTNNSDKSLVGRNTFVKL